MHRRAFTLVELLVVIAIIGLLSAVAAVALGSARSKGKAAKMAGDLKAIVAALDPYVDDNGGYPCFDHNWNDAWEITWSAPYIKWPVTPDVHYYHFEHGYVFTYSISIQDVPLADAQALDKLIDDGSLTTGNLRNSGGTDPIRMEWAGVDQTLAVPDPETCT